MQPQQQMQPTQPPQKYHPQPQQHSPRGSPSLGPMQRPVARYPSESYRPGYQGQYRPEPPRLQPSSSNGPQKAFGQPTFAQPYYPAEPIYRPQQGYYHAEQSYPVAQPGRLYSDPYSQIPQSGAPLHYPDPATTYREMPPPADPRRLVAAYQTPQPPADNNYMPDSSVAVASAAGKKSKVSTFPPVSLENIAKFREEAKKSNDPRLLLDLARYLLEAVPLVCVNDTDVKRAKKVREAMVLEAQRIVKKLATQGNFGKSGYAEAQFYMGNAYTGGLMGLPVDAEKAFGFYIQGSKQNHPGCTYRTAVCYEVGAGTKRDKAHAIQFFRKAANLGDPSAMYKLGMILLNGHIGQAKNPREGISWLKKAAAFADEDHPHALHELGLAYEKEGIPSVIPDVNYSRDLFTQAAQNGYAPSQFKLGLAYEHGYLNCPVDPRRSIAWYSKAAEQSNMEAALALSGWYLTGAEGILQQSDSECYLWARKAADHGSAKAEYAVGYYTETGIGVRQNIEDAKKWYMRAAAQGNRRAMQRLTELKNNGASRQQRQDHTRGPNGVPASKDSDCMIM
ncbi:hypothetical protein CLU79DRAFT_757455 [Phycomyces nitens]|nr:hypothetical protein CLU79DRAFT_757455 [Phycomyces nitens]